MELPGPDHLPDVVVMVAADFSGLVGCEPFFGHGEIVQRGDSNIILFIGVRSKTLRDLVRRSQQTLLQRPSQRIVYRLLPERLATFSW